MYYLLSLMPKNDINFKQANSKLKLLLVSGIYFILSTRGLKNKSTTKEFDQHIIVTESSMFGFCG